MSCRILGEKSSRHGKKQQRFLASSDCALEVPVQLCPESLCVVPQSRTGISHPQGGFWGALPSITPGQGQALGWQHRAEGLPQPDKENHF